MAPAPPGVPVPAAAATVGAGLLDLDVECHRLVRERRREGARACAACTGQRPKKPSQSLFFSNPF